jgi:hypothetical protein
MSNYKGQVFAGRRFPTLTRRNLSAEQSQRGPDAVTCSKKPPRFVCVLFKRLFPLIAQHFAAAHQPFEWHCHRRSMLMRRRPGRIYATDISTHKLPNSSDAGLGV